MTLAHSLPKKLCIILCASLNDNSTSYIALRRLIDSVIPILGEDSSKEIFTWMVDSKITGNKIWYLYKECDEKFDIFVKMLELCVANLRNDSTISEKPITYMLKMSDKARQLTLKVIPSKSIDALTDELLELI